VFRACKRVSSGNDPIGIVGQRAIFTEKEMDLLTQEGKERMFSKNSLTIGEKHHEIGLFFEEVSSLLKYFVLLSCPHSYIITDAFQVFA
jgi:hypothetical protein